MTTQLEKVCELAKEGRKAMEEPLQTRAASALLVLPELVKVLESYCRRDRSLIGLRDDLKASVQEFKQVMWAVRASNAEWIGESVGAGPIGRAYNRMAASLTAIEGVIKTMEDEP